MPLHCLCFVLPADLDELDHDADQKQHKSRTTRDCKSQIAAFLGESLRHVHDHLRWASFCHKNDHVAGSGSKRRSWVFYDLEGVQLTDKVGRDNPRIFSYAELYIGSNGFSDEEVLGSGGFGRVYRAVLPSDGTLVAVKCVAEKGGRFEKTFAAELVAVAHLRHRNLVRLRGWCVHEDQLLLVYDYMPNRSLDRVLFKNSVDPNAPPLSWERRGKIVKGLAAALFYLHEQLETQIIHRDVKTSNVMLDSHFNAKLGDFGLARWLEHELEYQANEIKIPSNREFRLAETTRIGGTIGYLPPESFQRKSTTTAKSDVFSFGIVALEVASGRRAVDLTYPDDQIVLLDWIRRLADEGKVLDAGDRRLPDGGYNLADVERMVHLGLLCTLHDPRSRPNMKWVVEALSGNIPGKLPALPSFQAHPLYISLSSPTNTSSSNTVTTGSSRTISTGSSASTVAPAATNYVTAVGDTIYQTARSNSNGNSSNSNISSESFRPRGFPMMVETPREIAYTEIVTATNNFSDSNRVAELDFGTAYHGFLENRHRVLVKRLGLKTCPALRLRFSNELQNLGRLRHRNLVQLRGWCTEQGEMLVVYDYSANRLLSHLLFHNSRRGDFNSVLPWHHRYNIIKSLATAILYLHEEWDEQVIHRNITSSAIILDPDVNPRLSSFALAEFLTRNEHGHHVVSQMSNKSACGIFGYMSPEYMESGEATTMTDIYSFGVVVLEVVTGQMAVDFRRPEVLLVKRVHEFEANNRPMEGLVDMSLNGQYDCKQLKRLVKLGIACTGSNPGLRPSARQIVSILDGNDRSFMEEEHRKESREEWKQRHASSLWMIKRIQALGIQ